MIDWNASVRRTLLVATALLLSAPLLRSSISCALVTRGDGLLYARDARASVMYRRAVEVDPGNEVAADRYAFAALLSHRRSEVEDGIRIASLGLAAHPDDAALRMDRALCLQRMKRFASAETDFRRVALQTRNVQALAFAAADARKLLRPAQARELLLLAARVDPHYAPVQRDLREMRP
jgi:tetratricopeptide (TPR) repeat protein